MSDTDLLFMPAVKAAALIRAKKLSPVDYVDTVLKAIERTQPRLNCFRVVMAEQARRDAKEAEEAVARGDKLGPLHGVPVSIKDLVDVKEPIRKELESVESVVIHCAAPFVRKEGAGCGRRNIVEFT